MCAASSSPGYPDLHHPLQYRKQEALWKQHCSLSHKVFCACGDFLSHFKWSSGGEDTEDPGDQNGGEEEDPGTESITGGTSGGEGDISDAELLR
nr:ORF2 [Torque teno Leptonychotes weddellii virus 1]